MWEELNRPRSATERSVAPAGVQPPPPSSAPLPPPPPPPAVGSVPPAGEGDTNADDDATPTPAKAEPRIDSQHLLLVGTGLFILIVVLSLTVFGGSNEATTAAVPAPTVTTPEVLPVVDEPTTVTTEVPEPTTTTTTTEPTAMGLPAALLDGPQSQVYRLYQTALGREPDRAGFQYWSDEVRAGTPLETLAQSFLASDEFRDQFGPDWTPLQRVELLLTNAFGPPADDAELEAWLKRYRGLEGAALLLAISEADETLTATGTLR